MFKLMNGEAIVASSPNPIYYDDAERAWFADNCWYTDADKAFVIVGVVPSVSPIEFKLLFSAQERVAIKAARQTDPVIEDFFSIVEDPRLTHVNLALQSTQDALTYLEVNGFITTERRQEILAGQVQ